MKIKSIRGLSLGRRKDVDMTEGNIIRHIITFALPLLIGNVFQQLYNTVDTWVVGNYVSNEAFSAVGTVGPIINMLIGFFMGLSSGAGVVISQYYGAKRNQEVHDTVHTAMVMTIVMGIAFTAIGLGMTPFMLRLMNTPDNVLPESTAYLTIYFSGILGLMVYNIGAGILRAVGDSQRPFYFLVVCAVLNTVLDLLFVLVFHMGVEGVAPYLTESGVKDVVAMMKPARVDLRMPKFKLEYDASLNDALMAMGVHTAFTGAADLSGIANGPLAVSDVLQKTVVDVDEAGTEAAAVTAIIVKMTSARVEPAVQMNVNRPFYYMISDMESGRVLFIGRVMNL